MKPGPQKSISDTKLTVDDFEKLFHCLNDRKELREIFDQYCKKGKSEWDVEDIRHFLVKEQQVRKCYYESSYFLICFFRKLV